MIAILVIVLVEIYIIHRMWTRLQVFVLSMMRILDSLPNNKILDLSKLKAFSDNIINYAEMIISL